MTERDWLVEPSIARGALTLLSGAHALDVALALAASMTRGYGLPGPDGWARDLCVQGGAIVSGVALERLRDADGDMDNVHGLELLDPDGNARAFASDDVPALYAQVEAHRVALALLVDVEVDALSALADFAERLDVALLVLGSDAHRFSAGIAHSVLQMVELRDESYALVHRASRIGPLGAAIAFSTWSGPSWDGLVDPAALEVQADAVLHREDDKSTLEDDEDDRRISVSSSSSSADSLSPSGGEPRPLDAESTFLLDQLAEGPMPARVVQRRGAELGYSVRTLRKRAASLGIERRKTGMRGGWLWVPPARAAHA